MVAHTPSPYTNINLECLKDVNIRNDTIKLLEETAGKTFSDINCFLRSVSQSKKKKKKQTGPNQTYETSSCAAEGTRSRTKRQPTERERIFANDKTNEGLISKIYKQLIQLNDKK